MSKNNKTTKSLLDHKVQTLTLQRFGRAFTIALLLTVAALLVLELTNGRYIEVDIEGMPFFPALFGFVSFVFIVMAGKFLRRVLMREESYYDSETYFTGGGDSDTDTDTDANTDANSKTDSKPKPKSKPKTKGGQDAD